MRSNILPGFAAGAIRTISAEAIRPLDSCVPAPPTPTRFPSRPAPVVLVLARLPLPSVRASPRDPTRRDNETLNPYVLISSPEPLSFERRHNSATKAEETEMAKYVGFESMDALVDATVPTDIRRSGMMDMGKWTEPLSESEFLGMFKEMAGKNKVFKSFQGTGYYGTHVPTVIMRNVLENPGWYTQYTPYQAEISQGRLESLLNYQTMISDLTGLPMANASLLDEGTAAAEAMTMCSAVNRGKKPKFLISDKCHPQTIAVCQTRADGLGLEVVVGDENGFDYSGNDVCGILLQYPATDGAVIDSPPSSPPRGAAQGCRRRRFARAHVHQAPRRVGCGHLHRLGAAFRRAHGLRRPARRVPRHLGRLQASDARSHHRHLHRRGGGPRSSHGNADARTAHSPR